MTAVYKPGSVSAALFSKTKKSPKSKDGALASLFGGTKLPPRILQHVKENVTENKVEQTSLKRKTETDDADLSVNADPEVPNKKKKKKDKESVKVQLPPQQEDFPFTHESLVNKKKEEIITTKHKGNKKKITNAERKKEDELAEKRPRRNRKRDKTADKRTLFVGNCPLSADKKILRRLFKDYGEIETIRFRCAPAAEPNLPRRAIVITKNFHDKGKSFIAYIVFKEEESANKAVEKNGFVLDGLHLRVDIAASSDKHEKKKSIFIGNLPFDVNEDEIRKHIEDCGAVVNVRIVRDRQTSIGKGICFVEFESKDSVGLAIKLNGYEFQGRKLRVTACFSKAKLEKKKTPNSRKLRDAANKDDKSTTTDKDKKKMSFAPSNVSTTASKFHLKLKAKKEKRLRNIKKKTHVKKTDQVTKILGEAPVMPSKKGKKELGNKGKGKTVKGGKNKGKGSMGDSGSFSGKRGAQPFKGNKRKHQSKGKR